MKLRKFVLLGLLGAPLLAHAQVGIGLNINVGEAPPPPRYERVMVAPGPNYVWIGGHWAWHGRWVWEGGRWESRHPGAVWINGHWDRNGPGWVWVDGRWDARPAPGYSEAYVEAAPPAPYVESIPTAPGPEFFWVGGRWAWQGRWVWVHGSYQRHPHYHPGAAWMGGHWDHRDRGYVWVEGSWR
jgi:hypothetical protein